MKALLGFQELFKTLLKEGLGVHTPFVHLTTNGNADLFLHRWENFEMKLRLRRSRLLLAISAVLLASLHPAVADARFSMEERCFGYRVFDLNDTKVNLRQSPNGRIVRTVANGTKVTDTYPETPPSPPNWMPVLYQNQTVYVWRRFLYRLIYEVVDPKDRSVNLRRSPNGSIIRALPNATLVMLLAPQGNWSKVRLENGQEGYVFSKFLREPGCF
jgi:hypothetical protein